MRVFYLKLTKADFETILPNQWQSPIVDLYDNNSYRNYSTVKSFYGQEFNSGDWVSNQKYVWTDIDKLNGAPEFDHPYPLRNPTVGPFGIAIDKKGKLYINDSGSGNVLVGNPDGSNSLLATGFSGALSGIAINSVGNVYVLDVNNHLLIKIAFDGSQSIVTSNLNVPYGIAIDSFDNIYITDTGNGQIIKIDNHNNETIIASGFSFPMGITIDALDNVYVSDFIMGQIFKIEKNGSVTIFRSGLLSPIGIAFDFIGNFWLADYGANQIIKIDPNGNSQVFDSNSFAGTGMQDPFGICISTSGDVFISDLNGNQILKIPNGSHRYVDYSAPIDVVNYSVITSGAYMGNTTLDLSSTLDPNLAIEDWLSVSEYTQSGGINQSGIDHYIQFNLNFDNYPGDDAVVYLRVEIGTPVITPKYKITQELLYNFPEWMSIRESDYETLQATPQLATPTSLGGALINTVSGEWLEDLKLGIRDGLHNSYIDTVDLTQMAWCYKTTAVPQYVDSIMGDGVELTRAHSDQEFNEANTTEHVALWDESSQVIYSNLLYNNFTINGILQNQSIHHVWNSLDELGVLVDLSRILAESNTSYQARIYDVFKNPLGAGYNSFKLALRRELNMWSLYGSTPDSNYSGATPEILEMTDIETDPNFIYPNGLPKLKFTRLVRGLANEYPTTWGHFSWDKMLWDMGGTDYSGYTLLPKAFDASPLSATDTQSGVGDGDDLLVLNPNRVTGPHSFSAEIVMKGKYADYTNPINYYSPMSFDVQIQAVAAKYVQNNPLTTVWFSVEVTLNEDSIPITGISVVGDAVTLSTISADPNAIPYTWVGGSYITLFGLGSAGIPDGSYQISSTTPGSFAISLPGVTETLPINPGLAFVNTYIYNFELSNTDLSTDGAWNGPSFYVVNPGGSKYIIDSDGFINPEFIFQNKFDETKYLNQKINSRNINEIKIFVGKWSIFDRYHQFYPTTDIFRGYISFPLTSMQLDHTSPILGSYLSVIQDSTTIPLSRFSLIMTTKESGRALGYWYSDPIIVPVIVNNNADLTTELETIIELPHINWDPNILSDAQAISLGKNPSEYIIKIVTNDGKFSPPITPTYGAMVTPITGSSFFVDESYIKVSGLPGGATVGGGTASPWVIDSVRIPALLDSVTLTSGITSLSFQANSGTLYPVNGYGWIPFVSDPYVLSGIVDENGPWINGVAPVHNDSSSYNWATLDLHRSDFAIPYLPVDNPDYYIVNWIGISTDDPQVVAWFDSNSVIPLIQDGAAIYPAGSIRETLFNGNYAFSSLNVYLRLLPETPQWNPQLTSGTFFENENEYYVYSKPQEVITTNQAVFLDNVSRNGAPILVRTDATPSSYLRQVSFFNTSATPSYDNPVTMSIRNTEIVKGTGFDYIYAGYADIYNIIITDTTDPNNLVSITPISNTTSDNVIMLGFATSHDSTYEITYTVTNSFYADNSYVDTQGNQHTFVRMDSAPISTYIIDYESSTFQDTTSIPLALNPLHTNVDEGFIFLSHQEYDYAGTIVEVNPKVLRLDSNDYLSITLRSLDTFGNPKPNEHHEIRCNYGTLSAQSVITDSEGYATVILFANTNSDANGTITTATQEMVGLARTGESTYYCTFFTVIPKPVIPGYLYAVIAHDTIAANGTSQNVIYGKAFDSYNNPKPNVNIRWVKARSNYELFATNNNTTGSVVTAIDGTFTIGPFPSETVPGYWFVSLSSDLIAGGSLGSTLIDFGTVGDVVYWYEYSPSLDGVENMSGLPMAPVQSATPIHVIPPYSYGNFYPVSYSESAVVPTTPIASPTIQSVYTPINATSGPYSSPLQPHTSGDGEVPWDYSNSPSSELPFPLPHVNLNAADPVIYWVPPQWYGIPLYEQYQLGLIDLNLLHDTGGEV